MTKPKITDVPTQVFEQFLQGLEKDGVSAELIARLKKTLLVEKVFSEAALTDAVLKEESLP